MNIIIFSKNFLIILLAFTVLTGCSSKKVVQTTQIQQELVQNDDEEFLDEFNDEMEVEETSDPLSGYNRAMTSFNDTLYVYVLRPVSKGYHAITHKEVRNGVSNFFNNILYPIRLVNNLLQGKFANSAEETGRFIINSTIGIFGIFDPAKSYFNLEPHNEDFGQTLGFYGVGAGPHIVLPFFGPSNLRDMISIVPDSILNPVDHHDGRNYNLTDSMEETILLKSFKMVNKTAKNGQFYDQIRKDAVDLYIYQRDMYEKYRQNQILE